MLAWLPRRSWIEHVFPTILVVHSSFLYHPPRQDLFARLPRGLALLVHYLIIASWLRASSEVSTFLATSLPFSSYNLPSSP
jgi:hypothetical protein